MFFRDIENVIRPVATVTRIVWLEEDERPGAAAIWQTFLADGSTTYISQFGYDEIWGAASNYVPAPPGTVLIDVDDEEGSAALRKIYRSPIIAWKIGQMSATQPVTVRGVIDFDEWAAVFPDRTVVNSSGRCWDDVEAYKRWVINGRRSEPDISS